MTGFEPGDIVLVPFPFSDLRGVKKRPALVLAVAESRRELVCLMLTSGPSGVGEVPVQDWQAAGLLRPTVARVHRLFVLDISLVLRRLGRLAADDFREVLAAVVAVLVRGKV
jgi:mRNA interferase MazF